MLASLVHPTMGKLARLLRRGRARRRRRGPADHPCGRGALGHARAAARDGRAAPEVDRRTREFSTARRSAITTTSRTSSTGCGSTRAWCIRARTSSDADDTLDEAQAAEARPHLPQAAAAARRALPRHRLRLGRARSSGRPQHYGVAGDRHHAVAEPVRLRASARSRARARRIACDVRAARLPRPARGRGRTTRSRASACSSTSGARTSGAISARSTALLKPGGLVLNHGITHNSLGASEPRQRHRRVRRGIRFPGRRARARVQRDRRDGRAGARDASMSRACASTTRGRCGTGSTGSKRTPSRARAKSARSGIRIWRIYMAGSAHAFERGWMSIYQVLAGKPLPNGRLAVPSTREYMYAA